MIIYIYVTVKTKTIKKFAKAKKQKKVSTKSAVFEHFTIRTDGKYYVCQHITVDDESPPQKKTV